MTGGRPENLSEIGGLGSDTATLLDDTLDAGVDVDGDGPIAAPVEKDVEIGVLRVWQNDSVIQEMPVFKAERVEPGSIHERARDAVEELVSGWMRGWLRLLTG